MDPYILQPDPALIILHVVSQQGLQLGTDLSNKSVPDPRHIDTDPDPWFLTSNYGPDPVLIIGGLQDAKKLSFFPKFFCLLLFEDTYT